MTKPTKPTFVNWVPDDDLTPTPHYPTGTTYTYVAAQTGKPLEIMDPKDVWEYRIGVTNPGDWDKPDEWGDKGVAKWPEDMRKKFGHGFD